MDILQMSKIKLLDKCQELGITVSNSKKKQELIELITSKQNIIASNNTNIKTENVKTNDIKKNFNFILNVFIRNFFN